MALDDSPQSLVELRPWLSEVESARRRGLDIPPLVHIAKLLEPNKEWCWTVACDIELLEIAHASLVAFPLRHNAANVVPDSNSATCPATESVGSVTQEESDDASVHS